MPTFTDERLLHHLIQAVRMEDVPEDRLQQVIGLAVGDSRASGKTESVAWFEVATAAAKVVRAVLSFDSWAHAPLTLGLRSVGANHWQEPRQYLFRAGSLDVDLRIARNGEQYTVSGQILGQDATGAVALQHEGKFLASSGASGPLDEFGEFQLGPVNPGRYTLELRLEDRVVAVPEFEVGSPDGTSSRGHP
jgi:hypothetical protein